MYNFWQKKVSLVFRYCDRRYRLLVLVWFRLVISLEVTSLPSTPQPVRLTNRLLDGAWQQSLGGGDKLFFHGLDSLRPSMQPVKGR